jgi:hypothetical protein
MNTLTNTTGFSSHLDQPAAAFLPALLNKFVALLRLSAGMNSIAPALLAERIVHD